MSPKKNKKILVSFAGIVLVLVFLLLGVKLALALDQTTLGLQPVAESTILPTTDIRVIVARIIQVALGVVGLLSVGMIIYAGWLWMTSGGEEDKISEAKKTMLNWAIGLIIIFLAFAIVTFIFQMLGVQMDGFIFSERPGTNSFGTGALGNGIIESHYPARDAVGIPRNTRIIVTFKEAISLSTIFDAAAGIRQTENPVTHVIKYSGFLNSDNIKIFAKELDDAATTEIEGALASTEVTVVTIDKKTFTFSPPLLGSQSHNMDYAVRLGEGLKKSNGDNAFPAGINSFYIWQFQVSTFLDITPPRVVDFFPQHDPLGGTPEYRNAIVQITFDEAIDPTTVDRLTVYELDAPNGLITKPVVGKFSISNQYKTLEFVPDDFCGVNSCGDEIFCLPKDTNLKVVAPAGTLYIDPITHEPSPDWPAKSDGLDGITDVCANSLNGNGTAGAICADDREVEIDGAFPFNCLGNTAAEVGGVPVVHLGHCACAIGPNPAPTAVQGATPPHWDNFVWQFKAGDEIKVTPPLLEEIKPGPTIDDRSWVNLAAAATGKFDGRMMGQTLTSDNIRLKTDNKILFPPDTTQPLDETDFLWYFIHFDNEGTPHQVPACQKASATRELNCTDLAGSQAMCQNSAWQCHWVSPNECFYGWPDIEDRPQCSDITNEAECGQTSGICAWQPTGGVNTTYKTKVYIEHRPYQETLRTQSSAFDYSTHFLSGVKDVYQNCYKPSSLHVNATDWCDGTDSCCISQYYYSYTGACPEPLPVDWTPEE
ncbi:MAG: hypothetical protein WC268_01975 [Patescibacteria group bacterium]